MPELLLGKPSTLEIEMDRFLARKNMPFKGDQDESLSIVQLLLKSWYSLARQHNFTAEGVQQLQVDLHFVYSVVTQRIPQTSDQMMVIHGLTNEVMNSAIQKLTVPCELLTQTTVEAIC